MAEEAKEAKTEETTTQTPAETGGNESQEQETTFTQSELDKIVGERARRAEKAAQKALLEGLGLDSVDDLKKTVNAYRKKQEAEMSELDKANAKLDKLQAEKLELEQAMQDLVLRHAVEAKAQALNFHNPGRAFDLIDLSGVTVEDGQVDGIEDALKALIEAEPYLVKSKEAPDIGATKTGKRTKETDTKAKDERLGIRFGIRG